MGLATFKGGVHPYDGKKLSENQPIEVLMPKGELVYPMSQHIGSPAVPLVQKGDPVLVGQKIGVSFRPMSSVRCPARSRASRSAVLPAETWWSV